MTEEDGQELANTTGACGIEDITSQRVSKVVKTIRYIQDRTVAMIGIWDTEAYIDLPVREEQPHNEGEAVLNSPALGNEGLLQNDFDALFDRFLRRTRHRRRAVIYGGFVEDCSCLVWLHENRRNCRGTWRHRSW